MVDIIIATGNKNKFREIKSTIAINGVKFISLAEFNDLPKIVEDGETFEENAIKKAVEIAKTTKCYALADDSGLEVEALGGKPGVLSARFAHENATDYENNQKLLDLLQNVPKDKRGARFQCAMAFASPEKLIFTTKGTCYGYITNRPIGDKGFGYDPLFARYEDHKTFAELDSTVKCRISHRAKALEKASIHLESFLIRNSLIS